jgi:tripartite ATP-independent transporter DctM subunit
MSPLTIGYLGVILMLVLMAAGLPIGFCMALLGWAGIWYFTSMEGASRMVATIPFNLISTYNYAVLPLFLFMANICLQTGLSRDLFTMVYKWMGRLPGGLAAAAIGAATIFGAVSASAVATSVTIGSVAIPEMKRYNYDPGLTTACVAAGGVLGILIPPSGIFIIYGILTEQSIGELFIAGVVPGIMLATMLMIMIVGRCLVNPKLGPVGPQTTWKEKFISIGPTAEMLLLILLVIGGLIIGWFTPTEAGAIGAFGAIVFSLVRKRLSWKGFKEALWTTASSVGMIYFLLIGAFVFNGFMALSTIPMELAGIVGGLSLPPWAIMALIIVIYIVLGCFLDGLAMILLTIPVFYPIVVTIGWDPIWFGVVIVLVTGIGMITPPVGMCVYVITGVAKDVPMSTVFKGIWPFFYVEILFAAILIAFPPIATWLPSIMK